MALYVYAHDNATLYDATFTCTLYRRAMWGTPVVTIATVSLSTLDTDSDVRNARTLNVEAQLVDEGTWTYFVYASGSSMENSTNLSHRGCRIDFDYMAP